MNDTLHILKTKLFVRVDDLANQGQLGNKRNTEQSINYRHSEVENQSSLGNLSPIYEKKMMKKAE